MITTNWNSMLPFQDKFNNDEMNNKNQRKNHSKGAVLNAHQLILVINGTIWSKHRLDHKLVLVLFILVKIKRL